MHATSGRDDAEQAATDFAAIHPAAGPDGVRIGAQLRAARLAARKTMAEVADEAGLTKGFVSKLGRDLANVSVASLFRLCDALGVPIGAMFQASKGEIVRQGEYPPIDFGGTGMREYGGALACLAGAPRYWLAASRPGLAKERA